MAYSYFSYVYGISHLEQKISNRRYNRYDDIVFGNLAKKFDQCT